MAVRTQISPPRTDPRRVREVLGATGGGVVVLVAILGLYLSAARYAPPSGPDPIKPEAPSSRLLPTSLGTLDRVWVVTGAEAIRQVRGLHLGGFPIDEAEVAGYGEDATMWVATPTRPASAGRYVTRMAEAIASADTPFAAAVPSADDPDVWWTEGSGQRHVFFAADGAVWWLAADGAIVDGAFAALRREVQG